jgi:hypothetical protein
MTKLRGKFLRMQSNGTRYKRLKNPKLVDYLSSSALIAKGWVEMLDLQIKKNVSSCNI